MRPILVAIAGGVGAGKKTLAEALVKNLPARAEAKLFPFDTEFGFLRKNTSQCLFVHGLVPYLEQKHAKFFDLKIFLDVPPDIRLCRILKASNYEWNQQLVEKYLKETRPFYLKNIVRQKAMADVWLGADYRKEHLDMVLEKVMAKIKDGHYVDSRNK